MGMGWEWEYDFPLWESPYGYPYGVGMEMEIPFPRQPWINRPQSSVYIFPSVSGITLYIEMVHHQIIYILKNWQNIFLQNCPRN